MLDELMRDARHGIYTALIDARHFPRRRQHIAFILRAIRACALPAIMPRSAIDAISRALLRCALIFIFIAMFAFDIARLLRCADIMPLLSIIHI